MKFFLSVFLIGAVNFSFAQNDGNSNFNRNRRFKISDFSLSYSGSIYNFSSKYLNHIHDLYAYSPPLWENTDSMLYHDNRSVIMAKLNLQRQLGNEQSHIYGNLSFGLSISTGGRIKASYISQYHSHIDTALINSEPVRDLDTTIVKQNEYVYYSTDVGFDIAFTVSSPPKNTFCAETGIGISGMHSVSETMFFTESFSVNHNYTNQYNRFLNFDELQTSTVKVQPASQILLKIYMPLIFSYKMTRNLSLMTMFHGGVELQKPEQKDFYIYPYFTIGIGCRLRF
ncbi:MAG TPA: hypothetical protein PLL66_04995 [Bacteroidales bacterium]|nr:hypothetical protein [Bacteroidales bacterium]